MVIRTDTSGVYGWDGSQWRQLMTSLSMPTGYFGYDANGDLIFSTGVPEIAIAPSNTNRLYMFYLGNVFKSDNFGATWSVTGFTPVADDGQNGNQSPKFHGPKMAVKPNDADTVYLGTEANGLWYTQNGGTSWTQVSSGQVAAAASTNGYAIVFSWTTPNTLWVGSYGNGFYANTNVSGAPGTFTALTSDPTDFWTARSDLSGNLWVCSVSGNPNLHKWNGSSWTNYTYDGSQPTRATCVAIDPDDSTHIVAIIDSGHVSVSTNGGSSWSGINFTQNAFSATAIPWLALGAPGTNQYMTAVECDIDQTSDRLYLAAGLGVWYLAFSTLTNPTP